MVDKRTFNLVRLIAFGLCFIAILVVALMACYLFFDEGDPDLKDAPHPYSEKYTKTIKENLSFKYQIKNNQVCLLKYIGEAKDPAIPLEIDGYKVIKINNSCFSYSGIESISIPVSVEVIDNFAFYNCTELKSLEILNGVKTIGNSAFEGCNKLTKVVFPQSVVEIGDKAFSDCSALATIEFDCKGDLEIGVAAFRSTAVANVTLPKSTIYVGSMAFGDCPNLKSLSIPKDADSDRQVTGHSSVSGYSAAKSITTTKKDQTTKPHEQATASHTEEDEDITYTKNSRRGQETTTEPSTNEESFLRGTLKKIFDVEEKPEYYTERETTVAKQNVEIPTVVEANN